MYVFQMKNFKIGERALSKVLLELVIDSFGLFSEFIYINEYELKKRSFSRIK